MRCIHAGIFPCFRQIVSLHAPFALLHNMARAPTIESRRPCGDRLCIPLEMYVISGCRYIRVPGSVYSRKYSRRDG